MAVVALSLVDNWYDFACMELLRWGLAAVICVLRVHIGYRIEFMTYVCCKIMLVRLSQAFFLVKKIGYISLVFDPHCNSCGFPYGLLWLWCVYPLVPLYVVNIVGFSLVYLLCIQIVFFPLTHLQIEVWFSLSLTLGCDIHHRQILYLAWLIWL